MEILGLIWKLSQLKTNKGVKSLFKWLVEAFVNRWPIEKELEMPDIPWFSLDEKILRLRENAMLAWVTLCKT